MLENLLQPKTQKSELQTLLELPAPTLDQLNQTESLLAEIIDQSRAELAALEADERARAADRLVGKDDGSAARAAARVKAQRRLDDATTAMQQTQAKASAEQCRIEKEADDAAWKIVREHIEARRKAVDALDCLVLEIMARFRELNEATAAAIKAAPVKPSGRDNPNWTLCPGRHPAEVGLAVMARISSALGNPLNVLHADENVMQVYQKAVSDGLASYTRTVEAVILAPANDAA